MGSLNWNEPKNRFGLKAAYWTAREMEWRADGMKLVLKGTESTFLLHGMRMKHDYQ